MDLVCLADSLLLDEGQGTRSISTRVVEDVKELKPLLNENAWRIVKLLAEREAYPTEIAKELQLNEQSVYYYVKQLRNAGLVDVVRSEEKKGAVAKYFRSTVKAISLVTNRKKLAKDAGTMTGASGKVMDKALEKFLHPFVRDGTLDAKIVVGSPDPHGPSKGRARDAHLAVELAAFFGLACSSLPFPLVYLDTQVKSLKEEDANLILVGGPITNKLAGEANEHLSIRFEPSGGHWVLKSAATGKEYTEDATGFIEKVQHPFFEDKAVLVVAGKRNAGTRAAVVALLRHPLETVKANKFDARIQGRVVEGLDLDGDGQIDDAEFKE